MSRIIFNNTVVDHLIVDCLGEIITYLSITCVFNCLCVNHHWNKVASHSKRYRSLTLHVAPQCNNASNIHWQFIQQHITQLTVHYHQRYSPILENIYFPTTTFHALHTLSLQGLYCLYRAFPVFDTMLAHCPLLANLAIAFADVIGTSLNFSEIRIAEHTTVMERMLAPIAAQIIHLQMNSPFPCSTLYQMTQLQSLRMSAWFFKESIFCECHQPLSIQHLDLAGLLIITDVQVIQLLDMFPQLVTLNMAGWTAITTEVFPRMIAKVPHLQKLIVSHKKPSATQFQAIAQFPSLHTLQVYSFEIFTEWPMYLQSCATLRKLIVCDPQMFEKAYIMTYREVPDPPESLPFTQQRLQAFHSLTQLHSLVISTECLHEYNEEEHQEIYLHRLQQNQHNDDIPQRFTISMQDIIQLVKSLIHLKTLELNVNEDVIEIITEWNALQSISHLKSLYLSVIEPQQIQTLRRMFPNMYINTCHNNLIQFLDNSNSQLY